MLDLRVSQSGDLELEDGGDLAISVELEELAQRCRATLGAQRGFWDFDTSWGLPWREQILGVRNPDLGAIAAVIRSELIGVEGVLAVPRCKVSLSSSRELGAEITCSTVWGSLELEEVLA